MPQDTFITLYDIPTTIQKGKTWSPFTWKTRYALNIKGIPYRTEWVDFPDVQSKMREIGAAPTGTRHDEPLWTVPTIYDPATNTTVSDSDAIAHYLDAQYPSTPALFPPGTAAMQKALVEFVVARLTYGPMFPLCILDIHACFTPQVQGWFRPRTEKIVGMSLEEFYEQDGKRKEMVRELLRTLDDLNRWIEVGDGVFFGGEKPVNVDTALAAVLTCIERTTGEDSELWKAIAKANDGRWARFMRAFEPWQTIDS
ncbi:hypothetical protein OF83DRAFT_1130174 [Amylostereum chailletii]|nr:hypothetical protein OF83DRAFT_1130174 [Amylostereum chailletii]